MEGSSRNDFEFPSTSFHPTMDRLPLEVKLEEINDTMDEIPLEVKAEDINDTSSKTDTVEGGETNTERLSNEIKTENSVISVDSKVSDTPSKATTADFKSTDEYREDTDKKTKEIKDELSEFLTFRDNDSRKRKRCEDEENMNSISDIFLRYMHPLNKIMDKTVTIGVFKSLNFKPAVLLNQCGKPSMLFTIETWDKFTKYESIIEAYLFNNLTGRKTAIGFENSDLEVDSIRHRGSQYVRFRELTKYKKILLNFEEFHTLCNLTPAINRYMHQLVTYGSIILDYLNNTINSNPSLPIIYGPIDNSIYNRLPQEVSFYRKTDFFYRRLQSGEVGNKELTVTNQNEEKKVMKLNLTRKPS